MQDTDRHSSLSLPFGIHRGIPLADLPRQQPDYVRWLSQQHWFPEKFPDHAEALRHGGQRPTEIKPEERTPEHNKLQNRFLDPAYARAFLQVAVAPKEVAAFERSVATLAAKALGREGDTTRAWIARLVREGLKRRVGSGYGVARSEEEKAAELEAAISSGANFLRLSVSGADGKRAVFKAGSPWSPFRLAPFAILEKDNVDVTLVTDTSVTYAVLGADRRQVLPLKELFFYEGNGIRIEVKPTISDDYPMVLRQMARSRSTHLLVGAFQAHGASREEFVEIFKRSKIAAVFHEDVIAFMESERLQEVAMLAADDI